MTASPSQAELVVRLRKVSVVMLKSVSRVATMAEIALAPEFTNSLTPPGLNSSKR